MDQEAVKERDNNGGEGRRRRRTSMKKIDNKQSLQVTFSKRRKGLFKKAEELSVLCGVEVAVIAFSPGGKPFTFGDVGSAIDRLSVPALHLHHDDDDDQKKKKDEEKKKKKDEEKNEMENRDAVDHHQVPSYGGLMEDQSLMMMMCDDELDQWLKNLTKDQAWADSCFD